MHALRHISTVMATTDDISKLASLLRDDGDKILTNRCKFTLSTDLLDELNDFFNTLVQSGESNSASSFHVLNHASPYTDFNTDLAFLHDFVQRSKSLKLTLGKPRDVRSDNVDISKFKEVHLLELHRINVNNIIGLSNLRAKLRHLVCERSLNSLRDVLERCGADEAEGGNWYELREAVLNHNGMNAIDGSLKYVPTLTTLDLSHNAIANCAELNGLPNLKHLNLSFNMLQRTPTFSADTCHSLQVLVLRNNFIEDVQSLSKLVNLTQLDLLENCLIEHSALIPLSYLAALQWLNLTGNPLSYHPHHRSNTVQYLHSNTSSVRFILDRDVLSSQERRRVGSLHPKCIFRQLESGMRLSEPSENLERSVRVRPAIISESKPEGEEMEKMSAPVSVETTKSQLEPECLEGVSKDYIKSLYGKTGVTPVDFCSGGGSLPSSSTPLQEYISDEMAKVNNETNNETSNYLTAPESPEETAEESGIYDEPEETDRLSDDDFESGDGNIFLVNIKDGQKDVFAILGKSQLVERNAITSKILSRFSLESVMVCIKTIENDIEYVYLEFETLRNNNYRYYAIESSEERERFFHRVKAIVDARPPKDVLKVFTCLKCSTSFGVEEQHTVHKDKVQCPSCNSDLVFEESNS